jgi:dihydroorotate dehydrogenase electron transfer subunit
MLCHQKKRAEVLNVSPSTNTSCSGPSKQRIEARIIEHNEVAFGCRRIVVEAPGLARSAEPGQFVHVLCSAANSTTDPLLRRPFSIHDVDVAAGLVSILYEIRGRGTSILSEKCPRETLDILGPLGVGFTLPTACDQQVLLMGGGFGVAPLHFLVRRIHEMSGCGLTTCAVGARTSSALLCVDDFEKLGPELMLATDDGTQGHAGFVTDLVVRYLERADRENPPILYACGPMPMLRNVALVANEYHVKCQVSVEAKMACGIGACMSCVIKVREEDGFKYVRACKEGPVFDAADILWE